MCSSDQMKRQKAFDTIFVEKNWLNWMRIGRHIIGIKHLETFNGQPCSEIVIWKRKEIVSMFGFSWTETTNVLTFFYRYSWYVRFLNVKNCRYVWFLGFSMFDFKRKIVVDIFGSLDLVCFVLNVRNCGYGQFETKWNYIKMTFYMIFQVQWVCFSKLNPH